MDVLYILGTGSEANNIEIRYSLRSIEKYMSDLRNVYIVGEDPGFLKDFKHVPARDIYDKKWQNAYSKVRLGASIGDLSDEFLLMNDDFFILEPFSGADFPFYARKNSNGGVDGMHSFQIHCPIRLKKEWYLALPIDIDSKQPHSPRTFYANFYKAPPKFCTDFILPGPMADKSYSEQVAGWPSFTIGTHLAKRSDFECWLNELYPMPSRYERSLLV